jgi:hypothetical protein
VGHCKTLVSASSMAPLRAWCHDAGGFWACG